MNAGYSWGSTGIKYVVGPNAGSFGDPPFGAGGSLKTSASPASAIGGLQLGYNFFQMQQWVVGVVTDVDARNGSDQRQIVLNSLGGGVGDRVSYTDRQKWLGTTRINLGFAPMNDWLLSAGAGIAYGQVNHTASQLDALGGGGFAVNSLSDSTTRIGWAVDAGIAYAVTPALSVGVEYLFVDLGNDTLSAQPTTVQSRQFPATSVTFHDRSNVARFVMNYKID